MNELEKKKFIRRETNVAVKAARAATDFVSVKRILSELEYLYYLDVDFPVAAEKFFALCIERGVFTKGLVCSFPLGSVFFIKRDRKKDRYFFSVVYNDGTTHNVILQVRYLLSLKVCRGTNKVAYADMLNAFEMCMFPSPYSRKEDKGFERLKRKLYERDF